MHRIAEIVFDQELEVLPSYIAQKPPQGVKEAVWYLGESIKLMAQADYYIGIDYNVFFSGCLVENEVAKQYKIPKTDVHVMDLMPDVRDADDAPWQSVENRLAFLYGDCQLPRYGSALTACQNSAKGEE